MKVIFLDIDGVIKRYMYDESKEHHTTYDYNPECIKQLNRITDATGAKIVIISCMRKLHSVDELSKILKSKGITGAIIDKTIDDYHNYEKRGDEIMEWWRRNNCESFIILDDEDDGLNYYGYLWIKTEFKIGLTEELANKAINWL